MNRSVGVVTLMRWLVCSNFGGVMRVINRLREPGKIRSVRLEPEKVTVIADNEVIAYRRVENEDVGV